MIQAPFKNLGALRLSLRTLRIIRDTKTPQWKHVKDTFTKIIGNIENCQEEPRELLCKRIIVGILQQGSLGIIFTFLLPLEDYSKILKLYFIWSIIKHSNISD